MEHEMAVGIVVSWLCSIYVGILHAGLTSLMSPAKLAVWSRD